MAVGVQAALVCMYVQVEEASAPAHEQPDGQRADDEAHRGLGALLHRLRQVGLEEHDRQAEREERRRVAEAPRETEARGGGARALTRAGEQRRDGREVIRIRRVTEAEDDGDDADQQEGGAVREGCDPVVEPEHVSPLSGRRARSWRDRPRG
jgi:hypothetical protein